MAARSARVALAVLVVLLGLMISGFGPPTLIESQAAQTPASPYTLKLMGADRVPQLLAKAAVIMDGTTGEVVYGKNAREHRAQASTTKMMTALVTLEHARLTDVVTAGPDVKVEPSIIGLDPGDKLTVEQLLYGLLLPSGNDAAVDLAEYVGGSIPEFAAMMNAKAAQLGLKDTHFVTPHGLDADGHYSSAYDLAVIARTALQNPVFQRIVGTKEYRINGPVRWDFKNTNQLLGVYPGADGVKTGYTDDAGRCLVLSATRNGHRAIAVVLDSEDTFGDAAALLDYFFANFTWETLSATDVPLGSYTEKDEILPTVGKTQPNLVFPGWQKPYLRWFYSLSPATATADGPAGVVTYYLFGKKAAEIPLFSTESPHQ